MANTPLPPSSKTPRPSIFGPPPSGGGTEGGSYSSGGGEGMDRVVKRSAWTRKRLLTVVGVILLLLLVTYGFLTAGGGRKLNVELEKISVAPVTYGPFQETVAATGNIVPRTTVYLDAVEGGRIEEIYVEEGAIIDRDDPILRLSNNQLELQLLNTETQRIEQVNRLEQMRFQIEQNNLSLRQQLIDMSYNIRRLERDFERNKELFDKGVLSAREFEQTKDEYEYWTNRRGLTIRAYQQDSLRQALQLIQMAGAVGRMDQNFAVIQDRLANLTIRAPVAGQLTQLNAELGEIRTSGFRFGQVDVLDGFKVEALIDEFYINRVRRGQQALTLPIAGEVYEMTVIRVYPEVTNGRFRADLAFVGAVPSQIRRGQTIRFRLEMGGLEEAVLIPRSAFFQVTGGNWIFVVDPSGDYAERRTITVGRQNPDFYEVTSGLEPGERVVTSSYETYDDIDRLVFN